METSTTPSSLLSSSTTLIIPNSQFFKPYKLPLFNPKVKNTPTLKTTGPHFFRQPLARPRAALDEKDEIATTPLLVQEEQPNREVEESIKVLKNAAKTRRVPAEEVLAALSAIKSVKLDTSGFLEKLGGLESPGRTWMLIFTTKDRLKTGSYFPVTAVQRFDAAAQRIENGVYLGPIGSLSFEGRFSWKKKILAFVFECLRLKVGPIGPFQINFGTKGEREPSTKDPFFTWFYIDEEIAVAQGKGGGTAFWCRCRRVST